MKVSALRRMSDMVYQQRLVQCDTCLHDRDGDCGGIVCLELIDPKTHCEDYEPRTTDGE